MEKKQMSKTARFIEGNRLQELLDMEEPKAEHFNLERDHGIFAPVNHSRFEWCKQQYEKELAACRTLPAPDCKFKIGEVYEEGKDYEVRTDWKPETKLYMEAYGDNPKDFPFEPIAVPIKAEESQNELVEELLSMYDEAITNPFGAREKIAEQIKSKFHIERKQQQST